MHAALFGDGLPGKIDLDLLPRSQLTPRIPQLAVNQDRELEPARPVRSLQHGHPLGFEVDPAEQPDRRLVVGRGMTAVVAGLAIGIGLAFASTRLLSTLLFGVGAADPTTFALVSLSLLAVALLACLLPARQAVRFEPAAVLRNE